MTVIAWDGKTLAADSMETDGGGFFLGNCKKLFRLKSGGMLGTAGDSDARAVISLVDNIKDDNDIPSKTEFEATRTDGVYLLVLPDKSVWIIDIAYDDKVFRAQANPYKSRFHAVGHGGDHAKVAMSLGKTSAEAVREACKWSPFCRLPVQTMTLESRPKEKIKRVRHPKPVPESE